MIKVKEVWCLSRHVLHAYLGLDLEKIYAAMQKDHPGRMSHHINDKYAHGVYAYGGREGPDDGPHIDTCRGPRMA